LKVLYFLTNYPFYSETFIAAEIVQLREAGHTPVICNFTFYNENQKGSNDKIINNSKNVGKHLFAIVSQLLKGDSLFFDRSFWYAVITSCIKKPSAIPKYLFMLLSVDYMLSKAKAENADIAVNHFLFKSTLAGSFIANKIDLPYHLRLHTKRYFYTEKVLKDILTKASKITAIASDVGDFYGDKSTSIEKIGIVRQSVDVSFLENFSGLNNNADIFQIVAIGRLIKKKGFDQLIEAFASLDTPTQKKCRLSIYGDGAERPYLQKMIETSGLQTKITLHGKTAHRDLMRVLSQANLLVVPSIELKEDIDGIPTVIIEAMLMKTAVLAYNTASISEIVKDQKTGFLIAANDSIGLSNKINQLVSNPALLEQVVTPAYHNVLKEYDHTLAKELSFENKE